jgi:flagellar biogenesis protein FliO
MNTSPEIWLAGLKMIAALALVIGLLFAGLHVFKRLFKDRLGVQDRDLIKVLSSAYVGVKKNIALVEVPGAVMVLGITNDRITLLSEISKEDVEQARRKESGAKPTSFKEHLSRLTRQSKLRRDS